MTRGSGDTHGSHLPSPSAGCTVCALDPPTPLGIASLCSWRRTQGGGTRCHIGHPRPWGWPDPQPSGLSRFRRLTPHPRRRAPPRTGGRPQGAEQVLAPAFGFPPPGPSACAWERPGRRHSAGLPAGSCAHGDAGPTTRRLSVLPDGPALVRPCPAAGDAADGPHPVRVPVVLGGRLLQRRPVLHKAVKRHPGRSRVLLGAPGRAAVTAWSGASDPGLPASAGTRQLGHTHGEWCHSRRRRGFKRIHRKFLRATLRILCLRCVNAIHDATVDLMIERRRQVQQRNEDNPHLHHFHVVYVPLGAEETNPWGDTE